MTETTGDKSAMLDELRIDRSAPDASASGWWKWLLGLVVVLVFGGVLWFVDVPTDGSIVPVKSAVARTSDGQRVGASVLDATGYVVARRQATVSSKATGKVVEVMIEEGVVVTQGDVLARLDDSIPRAQFELSQSRLRSAEAGLAELDVGLKQARLDLDRTQGLAQRSLASQADLDRDGLSVEALIARLSRAKSEIEVARSSLAVQAQLLDDMQIRAPFSGVVIAKAAQPGEMISPVSAGGGFTRTGICTIVDMDSLEIEVDVNESYINRVQPGQPVQVTLNAYPDDQYAAEVIAIIPAADRNKATVRVRVGFLARDARVLPDMGVRVAFLSEQTSVEREDVEPGVLIPTGAIASDDEGDFVYLIDDGKLQRQSVRSGGTEGGRVRVLTGLSNGQRVVALLSPEVLTQLSEGQSVSIGE